jgi:hypothetical protein
MSKKLKKKTNKKKEIQLPMEFNPGFVMFQPKLPLVKKHNKKIIKNVNWWAYIYLLIALLLIIGWAILMKLLR